LEAKPFRLELNEVKRVAVNEVKNRGEKGVLQGTPFFLRLFNELKRLFSTATEPSVCHQTSSAAKAKR
jgi:hypothetical protein